MQEIGHKQAGARSISMNRYASGIAEKRLVKHLLDYIYESPLYSGKYDK